MLTHATILWLLACLFFLRVLGQVLVAFFHVTFLPPMAEWYSGLVRWFGGTIPIFFRWVLAAYLFTFAHFHTPPARGDR